MISQLQNRLFSTHLRFSVSETRFVKGTLGKTGEGREREGILAVLYMYPVLVFKTGFNALVL